MNQKKINDIRKFLQDRGLKIENWPRFSIYLSIFNFERFLRDYCFIFVDGKTGHFLPNTTDSDIIKFILFEKKISTNLLKWFLFFESKFKKIIVERWIEFYDLENRNIFDVSKENFKKYIPNIDKCQDLEFKKFRYSLFEHCQNSEFLVEYDNLSKIPTRDLVCSWSFATTINFFRTLSDDLKKIILDDFHVPHEYHNIFDKSLSVLLKVRNTVSHNHIIYNFETSIFKIEFNKIYKSLFREETSISSSVTTYKIMKFIDYLLDWNLCTKEFKQDFVELNINMLAKDALFKIIYK